MSIHTLAILGFGTVGSGVYRIATENHDDILHREQIDLRVGRFCRIQPLRSWSSAWAA